MPENRIPDKKKVEALIDSLFEYLFPSACSSEVYNSKSHADILKDELGQILGCLNRNDKETANYFIRNLKTLKRVLLKDAEFILESDPAATKLIEVIAVYPGFFAIFCYRIANSLARLSVPLLPRLITEYAHRVTGIDIHPLATIGSPFSIDHGTGIVIGETTTIGNFVRLFQGVTLGALSVEKSKASKKRHPTIEDNVVLYAGSTILGGETRIGKNSIIGGNVWLTESIPPNSVVYHKSEVIVRNQDKTDGPINFVI